MSDMPSAREHGLYDLRRKRSAMAMLVVGAASIAPTLLLGDIALTALPAAAVFAYLAMPSWIGAEPRFPRASVGSAMLETLSASIVPLAGMTLMFFMINKGRLDVLGLAPVLLAGAVSYGAYRWLYRDVALATVRGERAGMSLGGRLWRHYLGYALGLSVATVALLIVRQIALDGEAVVLTEMVFVAAFLLTKSAVDASLPQPPLEAKRLSLAAAQLALMSPVWFGLPWGAAILGFFVSFDRYRMPLMWLIEQDAIVIVYMTVAAVVVFTAFALVAFAIEAATGEG